MIRCFRTYHFATNYHLPASLQRSCNGRLTVYGQINRKSTSGLQVDLRGHGIAVLKRMGLEEAFRAKSAPEQGLQIVDRSGRRRAYFPVNKSGEGQQGFTSDYEIMRCCFCDLFYERTNTQAKYIFGTSIEILMQEDDGVHVVFAHGTTGISDLVVGADGQWSRKRKMMLGTISKDPFHPLPGPT